jgi:hypothetical protein
MTYQPTMHRNLAEVTILAFFFATAMFCLLDYQNWSPELARQVREYVAWQ